MITNPMDILGQYPIRKSRKQKAAFREDVKSYLTGLGYSVDFEKGSMGAQNIIIGDPSNAKYLVTAHYDTPASIGIPNFITPTNPVTFLIYQILVVLFFLAVSFGAAFAVDALLNTPKFNLLVWYIVYFGLLFLMMFGPANRSNANDNTSGVVTVLETARTMPENQRSKVCFVLFDLEEAGLVGSAAYFKAHKMQAQRQMVLNLDCVGDGDEIVLFPTKKLKKDAEKMDKLTKICGKYGDKSISVRDKGFSYYPSDQKNFPLAVGLAAFNRKKGVGLYCSRIHTWRDTILEQTNVNILRSALTTLICQ